MPARNAPHLLGHRLQEVAAGAERQGALVGAPEEEPEVHLRADGVQAVLEGRDDPEIAPAPAQGPEEVGVLLGRGAQEPAVGGDHLHGEEVVGGQAVPCGTASRSRPPG